MDSHRPAQLSIAPFPQWTPTNGIGHRGWIRVLWIGPPVIYAKLRALEGLPVFAWDGWAGMATLGFVLTALGHRVGAWWIGRRQGWRAADLAHDLSLVLLPAVPMLLYAPNPLKLWLLGAFELLFTVFNALPTWRRNRP